MSSKCCRFERLIPAYLEGALSDRKRRWFEANLRRSDACRTELQVYRRIREEVARTNIEYPDPHAWQGFTAALRRRIEEATPVDEAPRREPKARALDMAAGAVGGAVCGALAAFVVVFFGFSSGLVPSMSPGATEDNLDRAAAMDAAFGTLTGDPADADADEYVAVELVAVGADGHPLRVTTTMDSAQLLRLLRSETIAVEQEPSDEWTESTPVLDGERAPIDLYGGANTFLVSSVTGR